MKRPSRPAILLGTIAALLAVPAAHSATLSWDLNGAAANTAVPVTGTWDGTNLFWNDASTGTGGTPRAGTTNADDLIFSSGSSYTAGTVTLSGARVASSITFEDNVAVTLSGGTSLTLGGSGTKSGVFVLAGDNQSNTLSTPIILDSSTSALTFSNAGTGLLTFNTGTMTGSAAGTQTINLASTSSGGITIQSNIGNGSGGGAVALSVNNSGSGVTTLTGTNTYTGTTTVSAGTLILSGTSGSIAASTAIVLNGGNLTLVNTTTAEGSVDRIGNSAVITSNGGIITYNNTSGGSTSYDEVVGTLNLNTGNLRIGFGGGMSSPGTQTLTLGSGSLTHAATNTSTITFSNPGGSQSRILINGQARTPANQIIGAWATYDSFNSAQPDFAVY